MLTNFGEKMFWKKRLKLLKREWDDNLKMEFNKNYVFY
jgi:hypothetical protein